MNGIMNENQLAFVKEYRFDNPLVQKIDSVIDKRYRDYHKNFFIHLNIDVYIIFILQILEIRK